MTGVLKEFTEEEAERFWSKVDKNGPWPYVVDLMDQCWVWIPPAKSNNGFGQFKFRGANQGAHRVSYMVSVGNMSNMIAVGHKCQNKICVNPNHLVARPKHVKPYKEKRAKCKRGHPLVPANTLKTDNRCRACNQANGRRRVLKSGGFDVSSFDFQLEADYNYKRIIKNHERSQDKCLNH